ncbi:unnamed protein product [Mytilus edulis]|uniref:Uncharacterized protein n=1 Tax=Mytilus edulis TaxID=6550 RepID=A0A8S3TQL9_MYTED|nr:unnamed protein product [Mytilus edulis]
MALTRSFADLSCSICMDDFEDPRLLPCFHTFCLRCIDGVIAAEYKDGTFKCPLCPEIIQVQRNGSKGFPINTFLERDFKLRDITCDVCDRKRHAVSKCRDCDQNFCHKCVDKHEKMQGTSSHIVHSIPSISKPRLPSCKEHDMEKLEYFCDSCNAVLCEVCIKYGHKYHPIQDLSSVADTLRNDINPYQQKIKELPDSYNYKKQIARQQQKLDHDENDVMDAIKEQTEKFKHVVDDVRNDFVRQLLEALSDSKNEIKDKKGFVTKNCEAANHLKQFAKLFVKNANDCDVIKYGPILKEKLHNLEYGNTDLLNLKKIEFIPKDISLNDVKRLFGFFNPAKYDFSFTGGVNIVQSFHSSLEDCTITSLTFMPDTSLWICMGNNGVLERYSFNGQKKAQIRLEHRIDAIASDSHGVLYVTCNAEKKIIMFNKNKSRKREHFIDTEMCVRGIAIDKNDHIVVGLTERDVFFDSTYPQIGSVTLISQEKIVNKLHGDDFVQYPARVAVNCTGAVAVSDWIGLCVKIFKKNKTVGFFDGKRNGFRHFLPRGICSTNDGSFIIVDTSSNCLHWITEDGNLQRTVESKGKMGEPYSVTVDNHDGIWIGTKDGRIVQLCI